MESYRKFILSGIIFIVIGTTFNIVFKDTIDTLGTVLIGVGGLFFIIGMSKKGKEVEKKNK